MADTTPQRQSQIPRMSGTFTDQIHNDSESSSDEQRLTPDQDVSLQADQRTSAPIPTPNDPTTQAEEAAISAEAKAIADAAARLEITHTDVVIAVMGLTGTGKSTFIELLTKSGLKIGHSLKSCTAEVGIHPFIYRDGRTIYLIDTPGFDDTHKTDTQVLQDLAYFFGATYSRHITLAGIIYLHRITDNRMGGSAFRNLSLFQKLCGTTSLSNVVLATTMWDELKTPEAQARGTRFEEELKSTDHFWGDMIDEHSTVFRQNDGVNSALQIVDHIMRLRKKAIVMDIQRQMIDEHQTLDQTSAGQEVQKDLVVAKLRYQEELAQISDSMKAALDANNKRAAQKLAKMQDNWVAKIKASDKDMEDLKQNFERVQEEKDKKYKEMIDELRVQNEKLDEEAKASSRDFEKMQSRQAQSEKDMLSLQKERDKSEVRWKEESAKQEKHFNQERTRLRKELREEMQRKTAEMEKKKSKNSGSMALIGALVIGAGLLTMNPLIIGAGGTMMASAGSSSNQGGGSGGQGNGTGSGDEGN
ncbi:hypothetical protein MMC25_007865 [Agyrium rufum]|nr:hypothetical protein [Agyrium rufum]